MVTAPRRCFPNCDDGLSKTLWVENGWKEKQLPKESLHDLIFDPTEHHNLVSDPTASQALAEDAWPPGSMDDANKRPFIAGPVPAPHGSQINNPDGLSPKEKPLRVS